MATRVLALQPRLLALSWIVSLALSGCDGGDDDAATPSPTVSSTTLSGAVVEGPVGGASVCAFTVAGAARGAALGNCVTSDATGNYSLSVPIAAGPVWLEATGGSYTDEATAATLSLAAGVTLTALVDANGSAASAHLTPLTRLALNAAVAAANVTPAGSTQGSAALLAAFGLPAELDILGSAPVVSGTPNACGQALVNLSRIVTNGLPLARLLATSTAASLSTGYIAAAAAAAAAAPAPAPAPTPAPTPAPAPPVASATATGSLALTGAIGATLVPDADGFLVKVANQDDLTFEFRKVTALAVGGGTANVTTSLAVTVTPPSVGSPDGTMTVTVRNPNGTFNPGLPQFTACAINCGVTIARPAGRQHAPGHADL